MVLPREWTSCTIKDIQSVEVQNGFSPQCVEYETARKSLSLGALTGFSLDLTQEKYISEKAELPLNSMLHKNDILVSRSNTKDKVGRAAVVLEDVVEYYYPDLMMRFQVDSQKADCRYVAMYLQSPMGRNYFMSHAAGTSTSMVKINKNVLESFPMVLPPLAEQKKIAETLSVWDSAIEKMEKLIEQKEKSLEVHLYKCYKNLLNGKKVSLGSLFDKEIFVEKGVNILKAEATDDGSVPVVGAGQTYTCYHHKCTHSFPTITISSSGAYAGYVWFHSIPIWASDCSVLYTKTMDIRYLYYFLKSKQQDIYKLQVGGAQPHVYAKDLKKMLIPDVDETIQKSVVIVFQQIELELSLLKQQLALYKKQKQGLMQKLLTGEWRVK